MKIQYAIRNILYNKSLKLFNMKKVNGDIIKKISLLAMVSLISVAAMAVIATPTVKANGAYALYVDPPYQHITVCTNFIVKVNLTTVTTLPGISFNLTFDPNLMECTGVTNTSFPLNPMEFVYEIDNTAGMVYVRTTVSIGFSGSGTIADITFHCKDEGIGSLNFTDYGPRDTVPFMLWNGTVEQVVPPVGGEVLTIDGLALLVPWIAAAGAAAAAMALVLAGRRFNR